MSVEFLIAILFGFGISGFIFNLTARHSASLGTRVSLPIARAIPIRNEQLGALELIASKLRAKSNIKIERALFELPEVIDLLAVCLQAGDGIYRAFEKVVPKSSGLLAKELEKILLAVRLGAAFSLEIKKLPMKLPHPQFEELASKVSLAVNRGTPVAQMLKDQAESSRAEIRNRLLRQAGKNETRMLIPLVFLILPITVLFAIYPSLKLLNFGII